MTEEIKIQSSEDRRPCPFCHQSMRRVLAYMRKRKEDFVWLHPWQCYGCNRVYVLPYNAGDDNGFQLVPTGKTNL